MDVPRGTFSTYLIFKRMKYKGYVFYKDFISWVAYNGSNSAALRAWSPDQLKYLIDLNSL